MEKKAAELSPAQVSSILDRYTKKRSRREDETLHDPAAREILSVLEENVAFFLENISQRIGRYEENLRALLRLRHPSDMAGQPLDTPLVRRTLMVKAALAKGGNDQAAAEEVAEAVMRSKEEELALKAPHITIKLVRERSAAAYNEGLSPAELAAAMATLQKPAGPAGSSSSKKNMLMNALAGLLGADGKKEGKGEEEEGSDADSDASSLLPVAEDCEPPEIEFPDNTPIVNNYQVLKRECYELSTMFNGINDWMLMSMQTMTPESHERELDVLQRVVKQVASVQEQLVEMYSSLEEYLSERLEREKACIRFPHITTYAQELLVADDEAWDELEQSWREIIRATLLVYSMMSKNLDCLVNVPTASSGMSLYQ